MDISRIPNVYEEIFSYLDMKSLCNACLVCKSWNELIEQSTRLMNKLCVHVNLLENQEPRNVCVPPWLFLLTSKKKFRTVKVKNILNPFYYNIKLLVELFRWKSLTLDTQLVHIGILNSSTFTNLTRLDISVLELSFVLGILKSTVNLRHLRLRPSHATRLEWDEVADQMPLLESFGLCLSDFLSHTARNINNFLRSHKGSLKLLELRGIIVNHETLEILTSMANLSCLMLKDVFTEIHEKVPMLSQFKTLKTLKLLDDFTFFKTFSSLACIAPSLTDLEIETLNQHRLKRIDASFRNLSTLRATTFDCISLSDAKMLPKLNFLRVKKAISIRHQRAIFNQVHRNMNNVSLCLYEELTRLPHRKISTKLIN